MVHFVNKKILLLVLSCGVCQIALPLVRAKSVANSVADNENISSKIAPQLLGGGVSSEEFFSRINQKFIAHRLLNVTPQQWMDTASVKLIIRREGLSNVSHKRIAEILEQLKVVFEMKQSINLAVERANEAYRKFDVAELETVNKGFSILVEASRRFEARNQQFSILCYTLNAVIVEVSPKVWQLTNDFRQRVVAACNGSSIAQVVEAWQKFGYVQEALADRLIAAFNGLKIALAAPEPTDETVVKSFIIARREFSKAYAMVLRSLQDFMSDSQRRFSAALKEEGGLVEEARDKLLGLLQEPQHRFVDVLDRFIEVGRIQKEIDSSGCVRKFEEAFSKLENTEISTLVEILELPNLEA